MAARLRRPGPLPVGPSQVRLPPRSDAAHAYPPIDVSVREPPKLSAKLTEVRSRAPCSGVWRSLVARFVRDEEVAGSNPVTPTRCDAGRRPVPRHEGRASFLLCVADASRLGIHDDAAGRKQE